MTDLSQSNWSETDANNNQAAPLGAPEGMAPSGVNDVIRAIMGANKRFWDRLNPTVTAGNTGNAYTYTSSVAAPSLMDGEIYSFFVPATNTGSATLNVNGSGATVITKAGTAGTVALDAGDLVLGTVAQVAWNSLSSKFILVVPPVAGPLASLSANLSANLRSVSAAITTDLRSLSLVIRADMDSTSAVARADLKSVSAFIKADMDSVSVVINASLRSVSSVINTDLHSISNVIDTNLHSVSAACFAALTADLRSVSNVIDTNLHSVSNVIDTNLRSVSAVLYNLISLNSNPVITSFSSGLAGVGSVTVSGIPSNTNRIVISVAHCRRTAASILKLSLVSSVDGIITSGYLGMAYLQTVGTIASGAYIGMFPSSGPSHNLDVHATLVNLHDGSGTWGYHASIMDEDVPADGTGYFQGTITNGYLSGLVFSLNTGSFSAGTISVVGYTS